MSAPRTLARPNPALAGKPPKGYVAATKLAQTLDLDDRFLRALARAAGIRSTRSPDGELLIDKRAFMRLIAD